MITIKKCWLDNSNDNNKIQSFALTCNYEFSLLFALSHKFVGALELSKAFGES